MPFISVRTSKNLSDADIITLKSGIGKAVELIPTKLEANTMIEVASDSHMYFGGETIDGTTFIDVRLYRTCAKEAKEAFANAVFAVLSEVAIDPQNVYMGFTEHENWAGRGRMY